MVHCEQENGVLNISVVNENGGIRILKVKLPDSEMFVWKECDKDDNRRDERFVSQTDKPVRKVKSGRLNNYRIMEIINMKLVQNHNTIFNDNMPKKWFLDIESEIVKGKSVNQLLQKVDGYKNAPINASAEVRTMSAVSDDVVILYGMKPLSSTQIHDLENMINSYINDKVNYSPGYSVIEKKWKLEYKQYDNEQQLLLGICGDCRNMPFISGWNFWKYDINYLCKRATQKYGMKNYIKSMSPTLTSYTMTLTDKFNKKNKVSFELPMHKIVVDYMHIMEKWDMSLKSKSNMGLDNISEMVLGIKKVKYQGTLNELYERDYVKFLWYNAIDSILVQQLDEKNNTYDTMVSLSNEGMVPLHESLYASKIIESMMSREYYTDGVVLVPDKDAEIDEGDYEGGYVKEPKPGIFNDVVIMDFQSKFPSIAMCINSGIDTYLGKITDGGKTYICRKTGSEIELDDQCIKSPSGAVFFKGKDSILRRVIGKGLFGRRVQNKHMSQSVENYISELKNLLKQNISI